MNRNRTTQEYKEALKKRGQNITLPNGTEYTDSKTKVAHQCLDCGAIWTARPDNVIRFGHNCDRAKKAEVKAMKERELVNKTIKDIQQAIADKTEEVEKDMATIKTEKRIIFWLSLIPLIVGVVTASVLGVALWFGVIFSTIISIYLRYKLSQDSPVYKQMKEKYGVKKL